MYILLKLNKAIQLFKKTLKKELKSNKYKIPALKANIFGVNITHVYNY